MQLRNAILIALAFDATPQEVEAAHDAIDRQFTGATPGSVDAKYLVTSQVEGATGAVSTTGTGIPMQTAATSTTLDLDAAGLPWDERIHSSNRQKTEKNVWRMKRNVDPALKSKVESELRATMGAGVTAATTTPPPAAPVAVAAPALPGAGLPPIPGAALPDPAYTALVQLIAQNTNSPANPTGRLNDAWVGQVLTHFGVADGSLQNLAHAPQLLPQIDAYIRQALAA
jgi:hypothetical protein